MVADGGGCCGAGGSRQWRRLGPVSLASAERAEENADVSRRPLIGRRRRGAGPAQSACAAAPLYPADSMVGRLFRLTGTTWVSPRLHRDCSEATPGEQRPAGTAPLRPGCSGLKVTPAAGGAKNRPGAPGSVRPPSERYHRAAAEHGGWATRSRRYGRARWQAAAPAPVGPGRPAPVPQGARSAHAPGGPALQRPLRAGRSARAAPAGAPAGPGVLGLERNSGPGLQTVPVRPHPP